MRASCGKYDPIEEIWPKTSNERDRLENTPLVFVAFFPWQILRLRHITADVFHT